jgi:transposase
MTPSIALGLRELGVAIVCIDARQAHQSLKAMKANKTDPHDAAGLAQLARTGFYKGVHVKSPVAHGVRAVITARGHLVEARVQLDNTIRGLCATFGIRLGIGQGQRFLARMREASMIPGLGEAVASLLGTRERMVEQIARLDRQLKAISVASPASSAPGRKGDGFVSMSRRALLHNPTAPAAAVWQGSINRANAPLTRDFVTFVPRYGAPLFVGNAAG